MDRAEENRRKAAKLVMLSHIFGWGGVGLALGLAPTLLILRAGTTVAGATAAVGLVAAVVGAILGQVGRGLQGRVI